jgi:hypothetical protein
MAEGDTGAGNAFAAGFGTLCTDGTLLAAFELQYTVSAIVLRHRPICNVLAHCVPFSGGR